MVYQRTNFIPLEACIRVYRVLPFIVEVMTIIKSVVIPLGLEPRTYSLEDCYSIQLSYGTISYYLLPTVVVTSIGDILSQSVILLLSTGLPPLYVAIVI